jgi:hypothetical protein
MDYRLTQVSNRIGIEPRQLQAVIWKAVKEENERSATTTSLPVEATDGLLFVFRIASGSLFLTGLNLPGVLGYQPRGPAYAEKRTAEVTAGAAC